MKTKINLSLAALLFLLLTITRAGADWVYNIVDLGTLGGATSSASGVTGQVPTAFGMLVGSSTTNDNIEHAFLYANSQMLDLSTLCDLSRSDFKVLTAAKSITDSCLIIGEGVTNKGQKHAFLMTPLPVDGGAALPPGTVFTVMSSNTTPIVGVFNNLANGSTKVIGSNTYLVSYTGGFGNDLTLTVQ